MSNIHILDKDTDHKTINCVFHMAVPAGNNSAGIPWQTAVKNYFNPEPIMTYNDEAENVDIGIGAIIERQITVRFSSVSISDSDRLNEINAAYNKIKIEIITTLAEKLKFFGLEV